MDVGGVENLADEAGSGVQVGLSRRGTVGPAGWGVERGCSFDEMAKGVVCAIEGIADTLLVGDEEGHDAAEQADHALRK